MKVVALAGGSGSAKLLRGLQRLPVDLTVVVNVGDNAWMYGVYVCPDIDIATYALAGMVDRQKGWGIQGDAFETMGRLSKLGAETWFRLGDADLATCLARTQMLRDGKTLTTATGRIRKAFGVAARILPVTDTEVPTWVRTPKGWMHLQEFWVRERGTPRALGVAYRGARKARVTEAVESAIAGADRVIVCPGNPVTSIGPMLAVPGLVGALRRTKARVVALSPMIGRSPFSGPAGKLLKASGVRPDSVGVASLYSSFLDAILIASQDAGLEAAVRSLGVECAASETRMNSQADEARLAQELLEL